MPDLDSDRPHLSQAPRNEISPRKSAAAVGLRPDEMADLMHIMADLEPMSAGELDAGEIPLVPREKRSVELPNGEIMLLVEYEALKARKQRNQADCRGRRRAAAEAARPAVVRLSRAEMAVEAKRFVEWAKLDGPRQRQFRRKGRQYVHARVVLLELRRETGVTPKPAAFRHRFTARFGDIAPAAAIQVLRQLKTLEQPGGPWETVTDFREPSTRAAGNGDTNQ